MTDQKPTRIIKEPQWRTSTRQGNKQVRWFTCDNGREYTIKALSVATGLAECTLYSRISVYGWDSPLVLHNNAGAKRSRHDAIKEVYKQRREARSNTCPGQNEWAALGSKPRVENFKRIRPLDAFEQQGRLW